MAYHSSIAGQCLIGPASTVVGARREEGGLGTAAEAELGQQRRHVVLDRLLREPELLGDLAVREPFADQEEDPALLAGQPGHAWIRRWPRAQALEHDLGDAGVEGRLPGRHPSYRLDQVVAPHLLEDVTGRAGQDRGEQRLVVVVRREDERADG